MKQKSFTLIELLVVIVIIGILAGVIMISTSSSIDKANFAKAQAFSSTVQEELLSNLVSEWTFDEPEVSGKTLDSWGNNNAIVHGAQYKDSTTRECVSGGCYKFSKNNSNYIDVGSDLGLNKPENITVSVFVKKNGTQGSWTGVVGFRYTCWVLRINSNTAMFTYNNNNSAQFILKDDNWHYFVGTYDGTNIRFYVDGVLSTNPIPCSIAPLASGYTIQIGADQAQNFFDGLIDDVRIYNTALSSAQIKQNYIAGLNSMLANGNISKEEYNERINTLAHE